MRRLRQWRNKPEADRSMSFLKEFFKREIDKQMAAVTQQWMTLVPQPLLAATRLEGLSRGVLRVGVESSAHLYELDMLLRSGLERQIITSCKKAAIRKVQLRVCGRNDTPLASQPRPAAEADEEPGEQA